MSDLLNIGASGIRAYRTALSTVGENVANAETPGYTRREVRLREAATVSAKDPFQVQSYRSDGVSVMSLERVWDDFTAADARMASADASRAATRAQWMQQGEAAIDDGDSGVGAKLTAFFSAATTLSANPGGSLPRGQMLGALDQAAGQIRSAAAALTRVSNGIYDAANVTAESINDNLQALSSVNLALNRATRGSVAAANLADQRDQLLDELSAKIAIDTKYDEKGSVTVSLAGSAGSTLVERGNSFFINVERATDGRLALSRSGAEAIAIIPTGGSMAGLIDATAAIAGTRNTLDGIARDFISTVNTWNAQGVTPAGTPGGPLLAGSDAATLSVPAAPAARRDRGAQCRRQGQWQPPGAERAARRRRAGGADRGADRLQRAGVAVDA
jgi:flagellar hook-associated protein 1 FlgK